MNEKENWDVKEEERNSALFHFNLTLTFYGGEFFLHFPQNEILFM